jgi:WD40 repeat protein
MDGMKPYTLTLELTRGESASDDFRYREQEYLLRREDGYLSARLSWDSQFQEDLEELGKASPNRGAVQRLGDALGAFLRQLGWGEHEARLQEAAQEGREVHITFRLAAAELYSLPWELVTLRGSGQHLGELPRCHVHYEWPGVPAAAQHAAPQVKGGRILFAWSAAGGLIPTEEHLSALREVCERHDYRFDPKRDVVGPVSLRALSAALAASEEPIAALHILCHGARARDPGSSEYGLQWNAPEGGGTAFVDAGDLRQVLAPHKDKVRMVVLCACQSGNAVPDSHLGSVAQALHRVGIPAVVASRMPLTGRGSIQLTETLYEELLGQLTPLSRALSAVRGRLQENAESLDWASLQMYARGGDAVAMRPFIFRPYRGLLAFGPKHQRFFFGRETLQAELLRRVEEAVAGKLPRFQLVAGASGSGKSSLVMAGLMPHLPKASWDMVVMRPGEVSEAGARDPARLRTLAALQALLRQDGPGDAPPAGPATSPEEVLEEARRLRLKRPDRKLLLVVDQFEEVFTQIASLEEREAFVRTLWALSRDPALGLVVLATLRVDYFERCGELRLNAEGTRLDIVVYDDAHRLFVPQLQPDQLRSVIEGPARLVGLELEEWLTEQLQRDVGQEPGALPLLEYTLDLLWQRREGAVLTQRAYEQLGGVAGALTRTADQLIDGMSPAEQHQARRLLVEMVDFRDASTPYTRRRVWVSQVRPEEGAVREAFDSVLDRLVASRLVVRGGDGTTQGSTWLQVAHEALLRRWERLSVWVQEDRERVLQLRELQSWAEGWSAHQSDPDGGTSYLLTGDRLGYARSLQQKYPGALSAMSAGLIASSQARHERRSRAARTRVFLTVCVALLVAVVMGVMALGAWRAQLEAQEAARISAADVLSTEDPTTAALLLKEMGGREGNMPWVRSALQVLQEPISRAILVGHRGPLRTIAIAPDGRQVLTASDDGTARLWQLDGTGEALVLAGHEGKLFAATFSPDGKRVLTASEDGTARVWSRGNANEFVVLKGHGGALTAAAFSPDGARVVTASRDGTARVWQADGSGSPMVLQGHEGAVLDARFSPDGARILTASSDHTARIWPADGKGAPIVLAGHTQYVQTASFSWDGVRVLTASGDGTARVWQADGSGEPVILGPHDLGLHTASFSPDGYAVATATTLGKVYVWQLHSAGRPLVLEGHRRGVEALSFSANGYALLTASADGTARVWDLHGNTPPRILRGHDHAIVAATFGASSQQVLTASLDGTGRIWELDGVDELRPLEGVFPVFSPDGTRLVTKESGLAKLWTLDGRREPVKLQGPIEPTSRVEFSPDGRLLWAVCSDAVVRVWPGDGSGAPRELRGHTAAVSDVAFWPGGGLLATASQDGTARLWPLDGRGEPRVLQGQEGPMVGVELSPDGKWALTVSNDGTIRLWPTEGQGEARLLQRQQAWPPSVGFSPDGGQVVTSLGNELWLWPLDTQGEPRVLRGHTTRVVALNFSRDGRWLATTSEDGTARLWPLDGQGEPRVLQGHTGMVWRPEFSPDGKWISTYSNDGTARLWPLEGEGAPFVLAGHTSMVSMADFSPDSRWVLTASIDGTARLWSVDGMVPPLILQQGGLRPGSVTFSPDGTRIAAAFASTTQVWPLGASELEARLSKVTTACLPHMRRRQLLSEDASTAWEQQEACERNHHRALHDVGMDPSLGPGIATPREQERNQDPLKVPLRMSRTGVWALGSQLGLLVTAHVTEGAHLLPSNMKAQIQETASAFLLDVTVIPGLDSVPTDREAAAAWLLNEVIPIMTRQITEAYDEEHAALFEASIRANSLAAFYEPGPAGAAKARGLSEELERLRTRAKAPALLWRSLHKKIEAGAPLKQVAMEALQMNTAMSTYLLAGF